MVKKESNSKFLGRILFLLGEDKKKLPSIILMFLVLSFLDLLSLGLIGPYLSMILAPDKILDHPNFIKFINFFGLTININNLIIYIGIALIIVFLFKAFATIKINKMIIKYSWDKQTQLKTYMMDAYLNMEYSDFIEKNNSDYVQTIQGLVAIFTKHVLLNILKLISDILIAVIIIGFLLFIDSTIVISLLFILGLLAYIYQSKYREELKKLGKNVNETSRQIIQVITEGIQGTKAIRILGQNSFFQNKLINYAQKYADMQVRSNLINLIPKVSLEVIIMSLLVFLISGAFIIGTDMSSFAVTLGIIGFATLRLKPIVNNIINSLNKVNYGRYSTYKLYDELSNFQQKQKKERISNQISVNRANDFESLELNDIYFKYNKSKKWNLEAINLSVKKNESIGIIGSSGSGKTTLIDVLLGLIKPQKGIILYNNSNLLGMRDIWWSHVAYLPQEIFILDDTLKHNITLGFNDPSSSQLKLHDSLKRANLDIVVSQLPDKIDTFLGQSGVRLSGGQRQRVALARAFYFNRDVLVLDESTSALDDKAEKNIVSEIKRLKNKITLIVIAHRMKTVAHCDKIYRMEEGKIIEQGSYEEIVELRGYQN